MSINNRLNQVEKKADAKSGLNNLNAVYVQPDETTADFQERAEQQGNTKLFCVNVYPPDMNYNKIKYIHSLGDSKFEELNRTKSLNRILSEYRETITEPDELKRWDSLPGAK